MDGTQHIIIAISRQMGSGGTYTGYLLAKELGFTYVDREITRQAAERMGTDEGWLERYDERSSGLLTNILKGFSFGPPETAHVPAFKMPVYDRDLFKLECRIMEDIARKHNAVIVGRGAFHALKNHPGQIRVFIHAPLEFRVQRLMKVQGISDVHEAGATIEESDRKRTKFVRDLMGVSWTDARNFHLCIDARLVSYSASIEMIRALVREKTSPNRS